MVRSCVGWLLIAVNILIAVIVGGIVLWASTSARNPTVQDGTNLEQLGTYGRVPPFALTERSARMVTLDDLRGRVWVANFIYTECTESCPTQSLQLAQLQNEFAADTPLRLVSITVDPDHDTPEVLRRYAERYHATDRWWFLTGDKRAIYCLAKDGFRLSVVDPTAPAPPDCGPRLSFGPRPAWATHGSKGLFMHSARLVVVDGKAQIRAYHLATEPESLARLKANLRRILASPG